MQRIRRPLSILHQQRRGMTTPAIAIALLVIMMGLALIIDRIWLETAQLELRTATEAAALAAAGEMASDDLLRPNVPTDLRLSNARQMAGWIASQNAVGGIGVQLNTDAEQGDVRLGNLIPDTLGIRFEESTANPMTAVVTALRTRANNNPVALFISGATRVPYGDVAARAEASISNDLVGLRPCNDVPIPALPIAIWQADLTQQRGDTWDNLIEAGKGTDNYSFDGEGHTIIALPDGIPEMTLHSLRVGGKSSDPNVLLLDLGTGMSDTAVERQFQSGLTSDDLVDFDGELWIGQGITQEISASPQLDGAQSTGFQEILGERRICFLYSVTAAQRRQPYVTATISAVVAVRIMAVTSNSDGSCDVTVQPTVMTTRTAMLASENLSPSTNPFGDTASPGSSAAFTNSLSGSLTTRSTQTISTAIPNRYVYKLRLTQ